MKYFNLNILLFLDYLIDQSKDEVLSDVVSRYVQDISTELIGYQCEIKNYWDMNFNNFDWSTGYRFYGFETTSGIRCIVKDIGGKYIHYFGAQDVRLIIG